MSTGHEEVLNEQTEAHHTSYVMANVKLQVHPVQSSSVLRLGR